MDKQYWLILTLALLVLGVFAISRISDGLLERKKKLLMTEYKSHSDMTSDAIEENIETKLKSAKKFYNILLIITWGIVLCFVAYMTLIVWIASFYSRW